MAEAIVGSMLWKLQQVASREARTLVAVNEDIRSLRDKLMWMQAFLRDVQPSRRVQPNELIKVWLQQTRDAVFDAEDAVDQYFVQIDLSISRFPRWSHTIISCFASFTTQIVVRCDLSSRIRLINERLEGIIMNKDRYRLGESTTLGSVWRPSSSTSDLSEKIGRVDTQTGAAEVWSIYTQTKNYDNRDDVMLPLVGREELVNDLMYRLYKSSVNVENVITVTGESGVGKTKLVRTLYDRKQTLSHFDIYEWVSFGPNLSASDVLKIIIGRITDGEECQKDKITDKLKEILKGKKYLFVIDAELSDSEWSRIFRMLDVDVKSGSRIVRISQSPPHKPPPPYQEKRIAVPKFDDDDVVINLFKQTFLTYGRNELAEYPDEAIEKYRTKILENTKGLPLAVVLLSGLLRTKEYPNEWETVFDHLKKMQSKQIDKILSLCFDDLPYDMKSCLLYFAALPVNTFIKARNIVCMWMAEGFLVPKATTVEKVGEQYLKELIDRRLVNLAPVGYDLPGHARVAVQSKVHAFLQLEAQEQCFVEIHNGDDIPALSDVRRLSLQNHKDKYAALSHPLPKLRAILSNFEAEQEAPQVGEKPPNEAGGERGGNVDGPCLYQIRYSIRGGNKRKKQGKSCVQDLLKHSRFLRVIHFDGLEVNKELPAEIGKVVNLQYIRVTSCSLEKIPSSIDRLCNLQTLDVRGTMVRRLPDGFWKIQTLRHVLGDRLILPKRVGDLRNLQTLKSIKPDYDDAHAWGSKTFTHMIRLLYLHIRRGKNQGKQDIFSNRKNKAALVKAVAILKYLVVLIIKAPSIPSEVFTGPNLERLKAMELVGKLDDLPLNGIREMEVHNRLPNLKKLRLTETMVSQEFINQLGGLQFLSTLELTKNSFRQLIFKDGFRSLKELTVHEEALNKLEIHASALPKIGDLDIVSHSNELRVVIHGHSELVEHIKAEDEELFKIMDVIITRQVQVENNKECDSNA
ncbi:hypothetical protein C2845_PM13G05930 [Panicum miliaceum]|uniref:Disease resistance protein RPM1-like n=1 Tax=Panicum miliaceum TaxID=4540 RepID=A0A3L6RMY3_PANMI|nr:hypothetical protein C2845_PM13G05930 [Panicum miliaceum]